MTRLTLADIKAINTAAKFHPAQAADFPHPDEPTTYPAVKVGGALVFAYVDPSDGALRVDIDLSTTSPDLIRDGDESSVPLCITVQGARVFDDTEGARAAGQRHAEHRLGVFYRWFTSAGDTDLADTAGGLNIEDGGFWDDLGMILRRAVIDGRFLAPSVYKVDLVTDGDDEDAHAAAIVTLHNGLRLVTDYFGRGALCAAHQIGRYAAAEAMAALFSAIDDQLRRYERATLTTAW